jgi:hypothetical protein
MVGEGVVVDAVVAGVVNRQADLAVAGHPVPLDPVAPSGGGEQGQPDQAVAHRDADEGVVCH